MIIDCSFSCGMLQATAVDRMVSVFDLCSNSNRFSGAVMLRATPSEGQFSAYSSSQASSPLKKKLKKLKKISRFILFMSQLFQYILGVGWALKSPCVTMEMSST